MKWDANKLYKLVTRLYRGFAALCTILLLAGYVMELKLAFTMDLPPKLGVLIVDMPIFSFFVADVLRSCREAVLGFPKVLVLRKIENLGRIAVPTGWDVEEENGSLRVWDDCGLIRILGKTMNGQGLSTPPVLPWNEKAVLQPLANTLPGRNKIERCAFVMEKKRYRGFIGIAATDAGGQFLLYFINAGKADLPVIREIVESYAVTDRI